MKPSARVLVLLVVIAGLHLIGVMLHQMFLFQREFPHLDDHSLPSPSKDETLFGSGVVLWTVHPFLAVLRASGLDSSFPAPLAFVLDSIVWAAIVLALASLVRRAFRPRSPESG